MIIATLSQKGGVGKSTISRLLAVAVAKGDEALKVLIADCDPSQATNFHWHIQLANQYLALVIFGGAAFQAIVGFIADKVSNGAVIFVSSLMTLMIAFVIYIDLLPQYISVLLVFWGGFAFSNYTMALKELGDRYDDERLVVGSAVLAMTWSLVTIAGLPIIGIGVDVFGFLSFPFLLCTIYPIVMIVVLSRMVSGAQ